MARNDVYLYTNATSVANAVVTSQTVTTAASFPDLVLGDSPTYNFYFTDGTASWPSFAGNASYSVEWTLGTAGSDDSVILAHQTVATVITGGWSMVLPLNTGAILAQLNAARVSQAYPVVQLWQQVRVTDPSGYKTTYANIRTNLRLRTAPSGQVLPDDPLPSGYRVVKTDSAGVIADPANLIVANGIATLTGTQALTNKTVNGLSLEAVDEPATYNTLVGNNVGANIGNAAYQTVLGYQAGASLTTAYCGTFLGVQAGFRVTSGNYNLAIGVEALPYLTTGNNNSAVGGYDCLFSTTTGSNLCGIGYAAGYKNTTGSGSVFVGVNAGYENQTGDNIVAVGTNAGYYSTASDGTFVGYLAGYNVTTGAGNTLIGRYAGGNLTTGSNCIAIGDSVSFDSVSASNQVNIGGLYKGTRGGSAVLAGTTLPASDAALDFGSVSFRWRDGFFSRNLTAENNLIAGGGVYATGPLRTGAPAGGSQAEWKMGVRVAATTTLDTTQYIQVDVAGVLYKLAVVTS